MKTQREILDSITEATRRVTPFDTKEKQDKAFILNWLQTSPHICRQHRKPDKPNPHIAMMNILITPDHKKVAQFDHITSGLFLTPGGHLDEGETLQENVLREIEEELGIKLPEYTADPFFTAYLQTSTSGEHIEYWFLVEMDEETDLTQGADYEKEFKSHKWYELDEIFKLDRMHPYMKRVVQKIKETKSSTK